MAEVSKEYVCESCGSVFQISYLKDDVSYDPELCPFCGDMLNIGSEEEDEKSFYNREDLDTDDDFYRD